MSNGTGETSGWAVGFTAFASFMLVLIGVFHIIAGITGVINDTVYSVSKDYIVELDTTTWGWIHIIAGTIVLLAGLGIMTGAVWARMVGIFVAMVSMVANFVWLPYQPFWSILMIAIDVAVIWALTVYSEKEAERAVSG